MKSILRPMLASLADAPLDDPQFIYEPKYDGIRAVVEVMPHGRSRLWSRLGNEKTRQFPEVANALDTWARRLKQPVVIDGEIVALDQKGQPAGFQQLQGWIHLSGADQEPANRSRQVAFVAFDLLRHGNTDLRERPLVERRAALERLFGDTGSPLLRTSEIVRGDGRALYERALELGWEGLIAKRADSTYRSGERTPDWRKLKIVHEQEFVVGGWTEPRHMRTNFGALLLGVYEGPDRAALEPPERDGATRRPAPGRGVLLGRSVLDRPERHDATASPSRGGAPLRRSVLDTPERHSATASPSRRGAPLRRSVLNTPERHGATPTPSGGGAPLRRSVLDTPERHGATASPSRDGAPLRRSVLDTPERHGATASPSGGGAPRELIYVGHTGTGFNERELARVMKLLKPLETNACPFRVRPRTNERAHWVRPKLVAQVKFTEWTADASLRHPVYLGLRDDKKAQDIIREPETRLHATSSVRLKPDTTHEKTSTHEDQTMSPHHDPVKSRHASQTSSVRRKSKAPIGGVTVRSGAAPPGAAAAAPRVGARPASRAAAEASAGGTGISPTLIDQLHAIERSRQDGVLVLSDGDRLSVTNLHKVFWPKQKLTKGDLLRYYVEVAPYLLPAVADRPLVMKRFPNGITGQPFYQHRAEHVPDGVRVEHVSVVEKRPQMVGGHLKTLLYMTQLAAISQDPWFSRVPSLHDADHVALDLDPPAGAKFDRVLDVARWIREELDALGATGVPKTSGADGLHVYIPLPPGTPYEAGRLFCEIIATVVAQKHPKAATIERSVSARGAGVYVDYLQNILGKTLATAYSARASEWAGVSTPLTWEEIDLRIRREEFTIKTMTARIKTVGDLWTRLSQSKGVDLSRIERYAARAGKRRVKGRNHL